MKTKQNPAMAELILGYKLPNEAVRVFRETYLTNDFNPKFHNGAYHYHLLKINKQLIQILWMGNSLSQLLLDDLREYQVKLNAYLEGLNQ